MLSLVQSIGAIAATDNDSHPAVKKAQSRRRPVERAHPCAHLAASGEYRLDQLRFDEIHGGTPRLVVGTQACTVEYLSIVARHRRTDLGVASR
jgi:hypothetical protein